MTAGPNVRMHKVVKYRDKAGEHRYKIKAPNGRIVADCGEGYKRRSSRDEALYRLLYVLASNSYSIVEED